MKTSYDYKHYVYLKVPKQRYNEIINNKEEVKAREIQQWRDLYKNKLYNKRAGANTANKVKQRKILEKILRTLNNIKYNLLLNEEDKKDLTPYKLAKLANINYLTAKKYWTEELREEWKKDPDEAILSVKIMLDHI